MSKGITVQLTEEEWSRAAWIGIKRRIDSRISGLKIQSSYPLSATDNGVKDINFWDMDIEGACGELAVAKALGLQWEGRSFTFKKGDIGKNIQVRTTSKYSLIIRE